MRPFIAVLLSVLSLVISAPAIAAPAGEVSAAARPDAGRDGRSGRAHADIDGDGMSDDLEADVAGKPSHHRVDVVVTLNGPGNAESARRAVGPFDVRREFELIDGFAATMTVGQARSLAARGEVFRVEPDFPVSVLNDAANADFGTSAARGDFGVTGAGTTICVVDTGVDPGHEQLDSSTVAFTDEVNGRPEPYDDHGHGTHVAATALGDGIGSPDAGTYAGVAPGADLWAAKVLDSSGFGTDAQVVAGIEWCALHQDPVSETNPVDVISMSLGSGTSSDGGDAISQAANAAAAAGKVVVVAAGNSGDAPETIGSPAAAADVIAVGAVAEWSSAGDRDANASRGIHLAPFSSRGPTADGRVKPDVTAPGMSITSAQANTTAGYVTWNGTSMATPFVAGTAALMLERGAAPADVKGLITSTAENVGPPGQDNDWGFGLVDGYAAVARSAADGGDTAFPTHEFSSADVADNGAWTHTFEVTEPSVPIAATVLVEGSVTCLLPVGGACWWYGWDAPDLDVRLLDAHGNVVDESTCPLDCHAGSIGRQETIDVLPPAAGTYTLEVYPFDGEPNNGAGGAFTVDLFYGAGSDDGVVENTAPKADAVTASTSEDHGVQVDLSGTDAESCELEFSIVSGPTTGTLGAIADTSCSGAGPHTDSASVTYTPDANSHGTDSFTYAVADGPGLESSAVTVTIDVASVNDANPTASFSVTCSELSCSFTDTSSDPADAPYGSIASWSWDFGDGGVSTARSPSHDYASAGDYTVTLTVTDADGSTDGTSQSVTVGAAEAGITLHATGRKVRGVKSADLAWTPAPSGVVSVYRDGNVIPEAESVESTSYTDVIGKGGGSHTYQVCETEAPSVCSNEVTVTF